MYGKSRSAISRVLKPEKVERIIRQAAEERGEEAGKLLARIETARGTVQGSQACAEFCLV
eukprot:762418-Hanusia_phi.AAC.1